MSRIESFGKLLPIGTLFIMFCGSLKLVLYYGVFNISIADFLEIGEYVTLFVDDLLYYLSIFGAGLLFYFLYHGHVYPKGRNCPRDYT